MVTKAIEHLERHSGLESLRALPFYVFILICDRGQEMDCRAALKFQEVLAGCRSWTSGTFREMLDFCRENYQELWRDYAHSALTIDLKGFVDHLKNLRSEVGPAGYAEFESDIAMLARVLFRAGFILFPRRAHKEAYADFLCALRRCDSPPLRDMPATQTAAATAFNPLPLAETAARVPCSPESPAGPGKGMVGGAAPEDANSVTLPPRQDSPMAAKTRAPVIPVPGATWAKGTLRLVCVRVTEEARHVKTFSLASNDSSWFRYQPGQFITIEPVIEGKAVPRSYTLASTPTRPGLLEITVKRMPGGVVSNWLHDNMNVGMELRARGPFGRFSCLNCPRDKYLFLSAGSGITPVMSMLRYLYDLASPADVVFFHSAATEQDIVFRRELGFYAERDSRVHVFISLTSDPAESSWEGLRGRLDNELLHRIAPDFLERMVLACGPGGFMDKAKQLLAGNGFPLETQFDEESFVPKQKLPAQGARRESAGEKRRIVFVRSGKTFEISAEETILDAAEKCGIEITSSCRQGRCGTCRALMLSGEVIMPGQEVLGPDEIAGGEILTCVGQAQSSVVEVEL